MQGKLTEGWQLRKSSKRLSKKHLQEKMSSSKGNAERNFWQVPELIEYMLPFLDGESILNLSKAHSLTNMVLKNMSMSRSKMWEGLVNQIHEPWWTEERDLQVLNDILQTMGAPEALLLEFLHAICRKFASQEDPGSIWERREEVVVSCPCDISRHSVAPMGFRVLESVEGAMSSTIQKVERVAIEHLTGQDWTGDDWLNPLGARMKRQHEMVIEANFGIFFCDDQNDAENAKALLRCERATLEKLWVTGDLGQNGWEALAEALSMFPGLVMEEVEVDYRQHVREARREDLRSIWDRLQGDGAWWVGGFNDIGDKEIVRKEAPSDENMLYSKWVGWEKFLQLLVIEEDEYWKECWLAMESEKDGDGEDGGNEGEKQE